MARSKQPVPIYCIDNEFKLAVLIVLLIRIWRKKIRERAWYEANIEKTRSYHKVYYEANLLEKRTYEKAYREMNAEKIKAYNSAWCKANSKKRHATNRNRRAAMLQADGYLEFGEEINILQTQDYKCVYCGKDLIAGYHADHIVPLTKGGSNWGDNIQMLCQTCNNKKYVKLPWDYEKEIGYERGNPEFFSNPRMYTDIECMILLNA